MSTRKMPDVIYHYTSNDVLLKILEGKSLRMSARHHLNDTMEGEQFFSLLKTHDSQPSEEKIKKIRMALDPFEFYVACFSSNGDLLSQWRGYAGNGTGVSIGFKAKAILDLIKGSHELLLYKVEYANTLDDLSTKKAKAKAVAIKAILNSTGDPSYKAVQSFSKERWAIKPKGFSEEMEVRLILTIDHGKSNVNSATNRFRFGYSATTSEVREFCEFFLDDMPSLIESITLGPNNKTDEAALKRYLASKGLEQVEVKRTAISYR